MSTNFEICMAAKVKHNNKYSCTYTVDPLRAIENVVFDEPSTIVYWTDGTKTVVKCQNEEFDAEKGLAMAIAKKVLGNTGCYYEVFRKFLPRRHSELYEFVREHYRGNRVLERWGMKQ